MRHIRSTAAIVAALALSAAVAGPAAGASSTHADTVRNDPTEGSGPDLLMIENSVIERDAEGVTITLSFPTPVPGSYVYPEEIPPERWAYPEVFTGWAAVFNHPQNCTTSETPPYCGPGDRNEDVKYGMYHFGGHLSSLDVVDGQLMPDVGTDGSVILSGRLEARGCPHPGHATGRPGLRYGESRRRRRSMRSSHLMVRSTSRTRTSCTTRPGTRSAAAAGSRTFTTPLAPVALTGTDEGTGGPATSSPVRLGARASL